MVQEQAGEQSVQRSILDDVVDFAEDVGDTVGDAVSDAADTVGDAVSDRPTGRRRRLGRMGHGLRRRVGRRRLVLGQASAAWSATTGLAADLYEGDNPGRRRRRLGPRPAEHVGTRSPGWRQAWDVISVVERVGREKLSLAGELAWSWVSHLPQRVWRLVIDGWEGITGAAGWVWTGLVGAAGHAWDAVRACSTGWPRAPEASMRWIGSGLESGAAWAMDFVQNPSWDKPRPAGSTPA